MEQVSIIGLDLAKRVFQAHGSDHAGNKLFSHKLGRAELVEFFKKQPRTVVAMEACASAHFWGRTLQELGHEVKLLPPQYVKPFVKRQKNDAADAEAICEAAVRPNIKPVKVKTEDQQALAVLHRTRDSLVRARTAQINALRGHCVEFGLIAPQGHQGRTQLEQLVREGHPLLPAVAREGLMVLIGQLGTLDGGIDELEKKIKAHARADGQMRALQTVPGIGPLSAFAICTMGPDPRLFDSARGYAAWIGLVPLQNSSGGKQRLGHITRAGNAVLRQHLILGAMSWVMSVHRRSRRAEAAGPDGASGPAGAAADSTAPAWLTKLIARRPFKVAVIAVANRLARIVWALQVRGGVYQAPAAA
jgi:transposase